MNTQQKIAKLKQEIKSLEDSQKFCAHKWGETEYTPYLDSEMISSGEYEVTGIHHQPVMVPRLMNKDRWMRTCTKCGIAEHTEKRRVVDQPVRTEPDFK